MSSSRISLPPLWPVHSWNVINASIDAACSLFSFRTKIEFWKLIVINVSLLRIAHHVEDERRTYGKVVPWKIWQFSWANPIGTEEIVNCTWSSFYLPTHAMPIAKRTVASLSDSKKDHLPIIPCSPVQNSLQRPIFISSKMDSFVFHVGNWKFPYQDDLSCLWMEMLWHMRGFNHSI